MKVGLPDFPVIIILVQYGLYFFIQKKYIGQLTFFNLILM